MTHPAHRLPGFRVERRALLSLPAVGLLPGSAGLEGPLSFEDFAGAVGARVAKGTEDPEALLHQIAELGARLDARSVPRPELADFGGWDPPVRVRPVHRALPVMIIQWRLDPGAVLPAHNHTPGLVMSLCLEGECWVRHFERTGEAPPPGKSGEFELRETHAKLLRPGLGSTLTPDRDDIHTFQAGPQGALGVDVNVFLPGEGDWSMLAHEPIEGDDYLRRHSARWTGKP